MPSSDEPDTHPPGSTETLIVGGTVLGPDGPIVADVRILDGEVAALGPDLTTENEDATTIDAAGCWVGPGLVDLHVHFREPGQEHKEDIASGSAAAAAGGFTAVVAMPNTDPAVDAGHLARYIADRGRQIGIVDVIPSGCISLGRKGERLAHLDELWDAGVRIFTDDGDTVADAGLLRRAMEYVAQLGGIISQHAVDPGLAGSGQMHEGVLSSRLGMAGIPAEAEDTIIARDIALVRMTGVRYHVQHLSTAGSVQLIAAAKEEGLAVTGEVTPHHLAFGVETVAGTDPDYKMMPPLRSDADTAALRQGLIDGVIDIVATDHAPHAAHEKDVPFEEAPNGITGLEWAAAVVHETVGLGIGSFFDRMSVRPAAIGGITGHGLPVAAGNPANLVVFDPGGTTDIERSRSKSQNAPYFGRTWKGAVRTTMLRGVVTYDATQGAVAAGQVNS